MGLTLELWLLTLLDGYFPPPQPAHFSGPWLSPPVLSPYFFLLHSVSRPGGSGNPHFRPSLS